MIAYFPSNISDKYYKNPSMLSRVIAKNVGDVFLRHSVVKCCATTVHTYASCERYFHSCNKIGVFRAAWKDKCYSVEWWLLTNVLVNGPRFLLSDKRAESTPYEVVLNVSEVDVSDLLLESLRFLDHPDAAVHVVLEASDVWSQVTSLTNTRINQCWSVISHNH